uniref:Annexin n=1 Tax=Petromyzon marinus TaxID=7757 RepID=S4REX2_PETMA
MGVLTLIVSPMQQCSGSCYLPYVYGPTVKPYPNFNANNDAAALQKAITTKGVDEKTIISILTNRTNTQRQEIIKSYKNATSKDLATDLKGALSGHLETVILGLLMTPAIYDAHIIRQTLQGLGTDEECLIEMLVTRDNLRLRSMAVAYKSEFKSDMMQDIAKDTSGDFQKLVLALAKGARIEDSTKDHDLVDEDARELFEAGVKRKGTDVGKFITIMSQRSFSHLKKVFEAYKSYYPAGIVDSFEKEVGGDLRNAFVSLAKAINYTPGFFAEKLHDSMKGLGTKDHMLIHIMVSRCELDLLHIRTEFKKKYKKSLYSAIASDTNGDYEVALCNLCGQDDV